MVDSGIFEKCEISKTHEYLFQTYEDMAADYGVMMDVLKDKDATLKNAKMAMKIYREKLWNFKLVGVAQGNTLKEFIDCYEALIDLGYTHIAVGGLLKKTENTVRYLKVGSEELMIDVLTAIREKYNPTWLFVLGSFHPRRMELFDQLQVWGSDYKGWIFNYKKKEELINAIKNDRLKKLTKIEIGDLNICQVKKMTEQQIRFYLVRQFIEKKILHSIYGQE
jgi:hypothetical protein